MPDRVLDEQTKKRIDEMNYEAMLSRWRFAPSGDPMFQGAVGDYFAKVMAEKRDAPGGAAAHVAASKNIGWK